MGVVENLNSSDKLVDSDEDLCQKAQMGFVEGEEELVRRYARLVRICARPWFLAGGDSEDLIQEGMLGLLQAVRHFSPEREASFHTFAEICIHNKLRSAIRAANGGKHTPLNDSISFETPLMEENFAIGALLVGESPEEVLIHQEEEKQRLHQLRSQLSNFEQLVLSYYLEGHTGREIATRVGKTPKSVDNAVQRIRKKLAKIQHGVTSES